MPLPSLAFRQATGADSDALVALINAAFAVEKGKFKVQERITAEELQGYWSHGTFLVAERADSGTGADGNPTRHRMLACVFVEVLTPPAESRSGGVAYFALLSVDPAHQHQGLGRAMTAQAEAWAMQRGCHAMELDVLDLRPELQPMYEGMGYRVVSVRPSPVPERFTCPVQFVRMSKLLSAPEAGLRSNL
jgi:ribosomal protein S18 acetylase RimI-like enzyme